MLLQIGEPKHSKTRVSAAWEGKYNLALLIWTQTISNRGKKKQIIHTNIYIYIWGNLKATERTKCFIERQLRRLLVEMEERRRKITSERDQFGDEEELVAALWCPFEDLLSTNLWHQFSRETNRGIGYWIVMPSRKNEASGCCRELHLHPGFSFFF